MRSRVSLVERFEQRLPLVGNIRDSILRERYDRFAQNALTALPGPYLPWSPFAMRPGGVLAVMNDIWLNDRQAIFECGGGVSTLLSGRLLRQRGHGHLTTIEHDSSWVMRLRAAISAENLDEIVTVIHAPLVNSQFGPWYDIAAIPPGPVDLLVVDGPPAHEREREQERYPALPHFSHHLVDGATVILDDILRSGEQSVLDRWEREFPFTASRRTQEGAVAVGVFRSS